MIGIDKLKKFDAAELSSLLGKGDKTKLFEALQSKSGLESFGGLEGLGKWTEVVF